MTDWLPLGDLLAGKQPAAGACRRSGFRLPKHVENPQPVVVAGDDDDAAEEEAIEDVDYSLATDKQKELLHVYGLFPLRGRHSRRKSPPRALRERDLSKPIPAVGWQTYQQKFPPITKKRTRSERVEWLFCRRSWITMTSSYWSPDDDSVREIPEYIDHRFQGWEKRVNSYDLVDRGIHAFYPAPDRTKIQGTESQEIGGGGDPQEEGAQGRGA